MNKLEKYKWKVLIAIFSIIVVVILFFNYIQRTKNPEEYFNQKVVELMNAKRPEDVIALSENYIKTHPNSLDAWMYLSMAYYDVGNCAQAVATAYHVDLMVSPDDNSEQGMVARKLLTATLNSDICQEE